jgi:hypothetical protein
MVTEGDRFFFVHNHFYGECTSARADSSASADTGNFQVCDVGGIFESSPVPLSVSRQGSSSSSRTPSLVHRLCDWVNDTAAASSTSSSSSSNINTNTGTATATATVSTTNSATPVGTEVALSSAEGTSRDLSAPALQTGRQSGVTSKRKQPPSSSSSSGGGGVSSRKNKRKEQHQQLSLDATTIGPTATTTTTTTAIAVAIGAGGEPVTQQRPHGVGLDFIGGLHHPPRRAEHLCRLCDVCPLVHRGSNTSSRSSTADAQSSVGRGLGVPAAAAAEAAAVCTKTLREVRCGDVAWALGAPFVFGHCGGCEHVLYLTNMRVVPIAGGGSVSSQVAERRTMAVHAPTPQVTYLEKQKQRQCCVCALLLATCVVFGDRLAPFSPAFFCS